MNRCSKLLCFILDLYISADGYFSGVEKVYALSFSIYLNE